MNIFKKQRAFMQACGQETPFYFAREGNKETILWRELIKEEYWELLEALENAETGVENYTAAVHEAIDLIYVTVGLLNNLGVDGEACFNCIHEANMRKCVNGKVERRKDGKIQKPVGWKPANLKEVIK